MVGVGNGPGKEVVLLHYQPDVDAVRAFHDRLTAAGLQAWEHALDMAAGEEVDPEIIERIDCAALVLTCVSDAAMEREYFGKEWAWCQARLYDRKDRWLLYRVGAFDPAKLPKGADADNFFDLTLDDPETRMEQAIAHIQTLLGHERPLAVTCAVVAMTADECEQLLDNDKALAGLRELLQKCGGAATDLPDLLRPRYGQRPNDLQPFGDGRTIADVVWDAVPQVNRERQQQGLRPIQPVWLTEELCSADDQVRTRARDLWRKQDSLLFVDGASLALECHRNVIGTQFPQCDPLPQYGVVWLPPFTRLTAAHESSTDASVKQCATLHDWFRDWQSGKCLADQRVLGFDFTMPAALNSIVYRALAAARGSQLEPNPDNNENLDRGNAGGQGLGPLFRGGPR